MGRIPESDNDDNNDKSQKKKSENDIKLKKSSREEKNKKHNKINKSELKLNIHKKSSSSSIIDNTQPPQPLIGNSVMNLSGWSSHDDGNSANNENIADNIGNMTSSTITSASATTPMTQSFTTTNNTESIITSESLTSTNECNKTTSNTMISRSNSMNISIGSLKSPMDRHSYNTLLVRHEKTRQLDWNDVWARFEGNVGVSGDIILTTTSNDNDIETITVNEEISEESKQQVCNFLSYNFFNFLKKNYLLCILKIFKNLSFEVLPKTLSEKFTLKELQLMVEQMFQLAREKGIDSQGFVCKSCSHPLGVGFAPAQ